MIENHVITLLNKFSYVKNIVKTNETLKVENQKYLKDSRYPPGHFYSPIVSVDNIKDSESEIWKERIDETIEGINLNTIEQVELLQQLTQYYQEMPFRLEKQDNIRYFFKNGYYSFTDGIVLYSMIRHFEPSRIIEIGSGFSSAIMLDTNELFFENGILLTFIEPYPTRLFSLMKDTDLKKSKVYKNKVQSVSLDIYKELQEGDILFIDSSHIAKTGSDVNFILFEILPLLKSGVLIHFHDVFYPFEYPKNWVLSGRNFNEDYFLKAFLMYNTKFEILLFSEFIHKYHKDAFSGMPLCNKNFGGNLWLVKK